MIIDRKAQAALALHRFGFGPSGDSIAAIADDPRGALLAELDRPGAGIVTTDLPTSGEAARAVFDFRAEQQAKRKLAQRARKQAEAGTANASEADAPMTPGSKEMSEANRSARTNQKPDEKRQAPLPVRLIQNEARVRLAAAIGAELGFVERLVWFWSNHFCISAAKIVAMAGPYEREAIRPHVLGRFADLLAAAESHPAMLYYLDNVESVGADSIVGINRDKGLNENLAREILELHTLGVHGGYSQQDVTNFANVLTGWSWINRGEPDRGGDFVFLRRLHEPGEQTVIGKRYADSGMDQGRAVLADLARYPATAHHIAYKFASHFVADDPPPPLVEKLAVSFRDSDGDLKQAAKTLISADESWTPQRTKLKPPSAWIIAVLRLAGEPGPASADGPRAYVPRKPRRQGSPWSVGRLLAAQAALGEPLWRPRAPNGFADTQAAWIDSVPERLDVANEFAGWWPDDADPLVMLDQGLGPLASRETRETIAHAESRAQAVTLLVMSPEFLRR